MFLEIAWNLKAETLLGLITEEKTNTATQSECWRDKSLTAIKSIVLVTVFLNKQIGKFVKHSNANWLLSRLENQNVLPYSDLRP